VKVLQALQHHGHDLGNLILQQRNVSNGHQIREAAGSAQLHCDPQVALAAVAAHVLHNVLRLAFFKDRDLFAQLGYVGLNGNDLDGHRSARPSINRRVHLAVRALPADNESQMSSKERLATGARA